jgi:predicted nuclease of predicted toxin-antitoxin system
MRLLLDECMPRVLCADLPEHFCRTVGQMKWRGLKNGILLARASEEFDVFLTVDRSLRHQQNLKRFGIAVIVLLARNNNYEELQHFAPKILAAVATISAGSLVILDA